MNLEQLIYEVEVICNGIIIDDKIELLNQLKNKIAQMDKVDENIEFKINFFSYCFSRKTIPPTQQIAFFNDQLSKLSKNPGTAEMELILRVELLKAHRQHDIKRGWSLIEHIRHCIELTKQVASLPSVPRPMFWSACRYLDNDVQERFPAELESLYLRLVASTEDHKTLPDYWESQMLLGDYYLKHNQSEKALEIYRKLAAEESGTFRIGDLPKVNFYELKVAETLLSSNQKQEAVEILSKIPIVATDPWMEQVGDLLEKAGQPARARKIYEEVSEFYDACKSKDDSLSENSIRSSHSLTDKLKIKVKKPKIKPPPSSTVLRRKKS